MDERGAGIETVCTHLMDAIALLDQLGEDAEAANISLSLERLTTKYGVMVPSGASRDPR
ncbi:hypothetical protein [Sphingomonas pituitosa]|uniref:hypothetical protein n=1 Tax=Sphingomonas pituitosa TaxID=99597 RepID=UPI000A91E4DD|nr:hypothetical protein [Sphingomonas pituitosa]